jgi:hypothetical protein
MANIDHSGAGEFAAVEQNLQRYCPESSVELIIENSFYLQNNLKFRGFLDARLIHIDGGHFAEVVRNDLHIAQNVLGEGGIIIIDDYLHSGFPEVQEAVHQFYQRSNQIVAIPFAIGKNKLFLCEISHHGNLLQWLGEKMPADRKKPVRVMGYPAICLDPH